MASELLSDEEISEADVDRSLNTLKDFFNPSFVNQVKRTHHLCMKNGKIWRQMNPDGIFQIEDICLIQASADDQQLLVKKLLSCSKEVLSMINWKAWDLLQKQLCTPMSKGI